MLFMRAPTPNRVRPGQPDGGQFTALRRKEATGVRLCADVPELDLEPVQGPRDGRWEQSLAHQAYTRAGRLVGQSQLVVDAACREFARFHGIPDWMPHSWFDGALMRIEDGLDPVPPPPTPPTPRTPVEQYDFDDDGRNSQLDDKIDLEIANWHGERT